MKLYKSKKLQISLPKELQVKTSSTGLVGTSKTTSVIIDLNKNKHLYKARNKLISVKTPNTAALTSVMKRIGKTRKPYPGLEHLVQQTSTKTSQVSYTWSLMLKSPSEPIIFIQVISNAPFDTSFPIFEKSIHSLKMA